VVQSAADFTAEAEVVADFTAEVVAEAVTANPSPFQNSPCEQTFRRTIVLRVDADRSNVA
jgi:hypothetical protein